MAEIARRSINSLVTSSFSESSSGTVRQAVEDGAVVPLLYEGRIVPQHVHEAH